jgi:ribonuclease D
VKGSELSVEFMIRERITREELTELPLRQFSGDIVLVETHKMAKIAADYLRNFTVFGFDTETKPSFKKGDNHKVALLQLATNERAFLFRVQKVGLPEEIIRLLSSSGYLKPGVAIRDDLKALQKIRDFKPSGFIELQESARKLGIKDFSLKKLSAILLDFRISKSQQLSNWESDELNDQQLVYAATDAWASLKIFEKLQQSGSDEYV